MNKIEKMIKEMCPNGVEYKTLVELCIITAGGDVPKNNYSHQKGGKYQIPIISNGIGENAFYGYTDKPIIDMDSVTIADRGTIGWCEYRDYPYYPIVRLISLVPKENKSLNTKFLYYCLQDRKYNVPTTGISQLTIPVVSKEKIPVPPIEIQNEIVRILDNFTSLTAVLTARNKQYEYYRDKLLNEGVAETCMGDDKTCRGGASRARQ